VFHNVYVYYNFGSDQLKWTDASPLHHLSNATYIPPFLVINAAYDMGLENGATVFVKKLADKGVEAVHSIVDWTTHGSVTRSHVTVKLATTFITKLLNKDA